MTTLTSPSTLVDHAWQLSPPASGTEPKRPQWRWPVPVALLTWAVYTAAAVWMTESLHLEIGDSIARITNAREMLFSRDPHLAAVGLYWMPAPTVGQLPFMLFLSPLHHAELSGPLACAFVGALTVIVIANICFTIGLSKRLAVAFTLVYAFSPIVVYTNGNGMSEAWILFTSAIAMLGYLRWCTRHRTIDLAVLGGGLAALALVRYEGFALAPVIAVIAALNDGLGRPNGASLRAVLETCRSRWRRWATTASVAVLPAFFVLGLWILLNYVIARDPLYWYKLQKIVGHVTPGQYPTVPAHHALIPILYQVGKMVIGIVPATIVVGPLLLLARRTYEGVLTGLGILAGILIWPLIVLVGLVGNESSGVPRYFEPSTVFLAIGAIWIAANIRPKVPTLRAAVPVLLLAVLAISAIAGSIFLENPSRTSVEAENQFFSRVLGRHVVPLSDTALSAAPMWQRMAADLDRRLTPGNKVLIDVSEASFGLYVFTRHPDQYIVNSDRDYERTVADPIGKFDYIVIPNAHVTPGAEYAQFEQIVSTTAGGRWVKWKSYPIADVYEWVPSHGPS